ncbi:thiopeptide-type bacteriocin biosynthesis domain-containing protein [Sinosporangium album]|uniref:Thiopeptide-type bacteriocin biosynthesis domain-containing protein n=1 Tax=Sinosporangium album TaxID=504805 RepID=A0A1G8IMH3_9ACTN|nr:thiopeptide-type bacteriocin biosynthesis protein [Sinosporangium album]SDI20124.1 thiopeptide-type bacteriocin biosynthesis domain-containing protein [Sinosporangium album]
MPPHHLTTTAPHQLAAGVLAFLAGGDLDTVATDTGVDPVDLDEAAIAFQAAGLAALERRAETGWYQLRVQFPDWDTAEEIGARHLGPRLEQLQARGAVNGWWFLRKPPGWRLRLREADVPAVDQVLDELSAAGALTRWWPTIYEPETAAFGGPDGMQAAHDLFCADSIGVLEFARQDTPGLGRRELSIMLINALLQAAGLDWFERGDVFARVTGLRPAPATADTGRLEALTTNVRTLLAIPAQADTQPFEPGGPAAFAAPWLTAWQTAGNQLGRAAAEGRLNRGLRALLTHVVIFHWNRLGLSATTQGILSRAVTAAFLPES